MIECARWAQQIVPRSLTKLTWNIWRCDYVINNTIKADVGGSLQILREINLEKESQQARTAANAPAVEETAAKLENMTLTGKVLLCRYRPS
jgi:hypothetical protein